MAWFLLVISTVIFGCAVAVTLVSVIRSKKLPWRFNFWMISLAFVFQCAGLWFRGQEAGRCPLTTFADVLIFLSWSVVVVYMLVGTAYRLSLLGAFTAPLVFGLQTVALLMGLAPVPEIERRAPVNAFLELHAALSLVAYGVFGLACVAGCMFLLQRWQLKKHKLNMLFFELPAISTLATVNQRLLIFGLAILTTGLLAAIGLPELPEGMKLGVALAVWVFYAVIVGLQFGRGMSPSRTAWLSIAAFSFSLVTLWGVTAVGGVGG